VASRPTTRPLTTIADKAHQRPARFIPLTVNLDWL
jgi:hypothetical protein